MTKQELFVELLKIFYVDTDYWGQHISEARKHLEKIYEENLHHLEEEEDEVLDFQGYLLEFYKQFEEHVNSQIETAEESLENGDEEHVESLRNDWRKLQASSKVRIKLLNEIIEYDSEKEMENYIRKTYT